MVGVRQTKKKTVVKHKRDEEEEDHNPRARQLPRAYAQENTRKQRKKLAKRLRKTQEAYLSQSGVDYVTLAAASASGGRGGGGGDPVAPVCNVWCPRCRVKLTADQVEEGFTQSVLDYRTECPECQFRFETSFAFECEGADARFIWLCPEQTLDQFELWREKREFDDESDDDVAQILLQDRPEIFFNAYRYSDEGAEGGVKERVCQFLDI